MQGGCCSQRYTIRLLIMIQELCQINTPTPQHGAGLHFFPNGNVIEYENKVQVWCIILVPCFMKTVFQVNFRSTLYDYCVENVKIFEKVINNNCSFFRKNITYMVKNCAYEQRSFYQEMHRTRVRDQISLLTNSTFNYYVEIAMKN